MTVVHAVEVVSRIPAHASDAREDAKTAPTATASWIVPHADVTACVTAVHAADVASRIPAHASEARDAATIAPTATASWIVPQASWTDAPIDAHACSVLPCRSVQPFVTVASTENDPAVDVCSIDFHASDIDVEN